MSQKSLTEVATNRLVIVFSECSSVRPAPSLEDIRKRKVCVGAVRGGGCATAMCREYANVYTSILERRSNPSSHSRVGDRLVRFRVTDQEASVAAQRMRFRDVMFDVGYRAKTGVWGEWSYFNGRKVFARSSCFQGVLYSEGNSGRGFLHT